MSKNTFQIILGVLIIITPFLGVPNSWKTLFTLVLGVLIVMIALYSSIKGRSITPANENELDTSSTLQNEK